MADAKTTLALRDEIGRDRGTVNSRRASDELRQGGDWTSDVMDQRQPGDFL